MINMLIPDDVSMGVRRHSNEFASALAKLTLIRTTRILKTRPGGRMSYISYLSRPWLAQGRTREDELVHALHPIPFLSDCNLMTVYDMLAYKQLYIYQTTTPGAIYFNLLLRSIQAAPKIMVLAQYVKDDLVRMCGKKAEDIYVLHAGTHTEKFQMLEWTRRPRTILYVGDDNPRKNLPRLIQAVAKLKDVSLVWAGKVIHKEERYRVRNLAKKLGVYLEERGFVSERHLMELYNHVSLVVYPCIDDGGFGLPLIEAAACGTLSVVSDVPPFREVLGDKALYFDPLDVDSIADALDVGLLEAPIDRQALREHALQYDWRVIGPKMLKIYEEVAR